MHWEALEVRDGVRGRRTPEAVSIAESSQVPGCTRGGRWQNGPAKVVTLS